MDILITILIVVSIVGWEYLKIKRKMASEAQKAAARKKAYNVDEEYPEGGGRKRILHGKMKNLRRILRNPSHISLTSLFQTREQRSQARLLLTLP